jgi:antitoxin YobK
MAHAASAGIGETCPAQYEETPTPQRDRWFHPETMTDLDDALALITEHRDEGTFAGPASERLVERAEALLARTFPPTYRRFLQELGAGDLWGEEFYGIVDEDLEDPTAPNAVGLALAERADGTLPDQLLPVYHLGDGTIFGLDLSADMGGEAPVVSWHGDPRGGIQPEAPDFGSFLLETLTAARPRPAELNA